MIKLVEAIQILAKHQVDFVLVGGMAISAHGSAYVTVDLDICFSRSGENLRRIVNALTPLEPRLRGFPEHLPFFWDESTLRNGTNFTLRTNLCNIDLLGEVKGVGDFKDALAESVNIELAGYQINVLTIDGLIKAKTAAGRVKDQLILPELEALKAALSDEDAAG